MAESQGSYQEKTEQPTAKRLADARKEGNVPQSQEIGSAAVMVAGVLMLKIGGARLFDGMASAFPIIYQLIPNFEVNADNLQGYATAAVRYLGLMVAPFIIAVMALGLGARLAQSGLVLSGKTLQPKLSNLNPANNIKRIFSSRGAVELAKGVLKVIVVGIVGWVTLKAEIPRFVMLIDQDVREIIGRIFMACGKLAFRIALAIAALAVLDLLFQRWKYFHDLKMTRQEVKDEMRQTEGDPAIKGRIRQVQLKLSMNRMIKRLPEADVVVTNPTHIAVALKYDPNIMSAPRVIAKGMRKFAERIKALAVEHDIPIVEQPELARALYRSTDVGWEIPYELFQAVAEVLALVYRIRERKGHSYSEK